MWVQIQGDAVWWICLENEHDDVGYPDRWDSTLRSEMLSLDGDVGLVHGRREDWVGGLEADGRSLTGPMPVWE